MGPRQGCIGVAVSIAAEIIALRWGGRGERLSTVDGAIHHTHAPARG